jgi:hypothetical protein
MCDCFDTPDQQPDTPVQQPVVTDAGASDIFTVGPLETGTEVTLPEMYPDLVALVEAHPQPTFGPGETLPMVYPNAPTLADIEGHLSTVNTNIIDPNPGYTASYNDSMDQTEWSPTL